MIQDTLEEKRAKADAGIAERHFHKMGKSIMQMYLCNTNYQSSLKC